MTDRAQNVGTDNERQVETEKLEDAANNNGYTIEKVQGHYNKTRNKRLEV